MPGERTIGGLPADFVEITGKIFGKKQEEQCHQRPGELFTEKFLPQPTDAEPEQFLVITGQGLQLQRRQGRSS